MQYMRLHANNYRIMSSRDVTFMLFLLHNSAFTVLEKKFRPLKNRYASADRLFPIKKEKMFLLLIYLFLLSILCCQNITKMKRRLNLNDYFMYETLMCARDELLSLYYFYSILRTLFATRGS